MARIPITSKDGTSTPLFWSDKRDGDQPIKRVFRETDDGRVMRSRSLRYDTKKNQLKRV